MATPLSRELEAYIAVRSAPMTVAEYMRQALTHPLHGYYTNPTSNEGDEWDDDDAWDDETTSAHDFIIGSKGDFVTAPEDRKSSENAFACGSLHNGKSKESQRNFKLSKSVRVKEH